MKTLVDHLGQYAAYHRDPRNVATHFVGIPMIFLAVEVLLSRPVLALGPVALTPAMLLSVWSGLFYLRLDARFGAAMAAILAVSAWAGLAIARQATGIWIGTGLGLFLVGWIVQFVGHHYEGRKPAFLDDLVGLIVGPLFLVAEAAFHFDLRPEVRRAVEQRAGAATAGQK